MLLNHENIQKLLDEVAEKLGHPIHLDYNCSYYNNKKIVINGKVLTYNEVMKLKNGEWILLRFAEVTALIKKLLKQEEEMCT